nr:putative internal virion protein [uncultured Mediterranean phage uvMED]BAR29439.1 putative internal virion protein [uncultured Mediterranean phage uvMED]BAR29447.1 putative internal virion protein [uncultured Mediterranean phage uvMED]
MANFTFGLNLNETAQESGYDQFKTTFGQALGATYEETINFNPAVRAYSSYQIATAKNESANSGAEKINKDELNKEYSELGLYFDNDEYQSVVDIMVNQKKEERERQSILERGPQGSWNPFSSGFYVGASKLAVGIGASFLDPINIGASFIPVFGQARFAALAARTTLTKARTIRGAVEGSFGAAVVEPIVYSSAKQVQADYGIVDSFMNIGFGTILGTGLHVGAGKLKDIRTARKFQEQLIKNKKDLDTGTGGEPELNLYKQYYPENSDIMMKLEKTDPRTRELLLKKAIGDVMQENPVDVTGVANADATLRSSKAEAPTTKIEGTKKLTTDELELQNFNNKIINKDAKALETDTPIMEQRLLDLRNKQTEKGLNYELKSQAGEQTVQSTKDDLEAIKTREKDLNDTLVDHINCINGR